jgi:hypothetical protein
MSLSRTAAGMVLLLTGVVLSAAPSAWAHTESSTAPAASAVTPAPLTAAASLAARVEVVAAATPAAVPGWLALLALVTVALLAMKTPRRMAAAAFVVLLAIVAFETGVHGVHHLGDTHAASHCVVASVAPHLGGATDAPVTDTPHLLVTADSVAVADELVLAACPLGPCPGRSPPALAS